MYYMAVYAGSILGSWLILLLLKLVYRKLRRRPNGHADVAALGLLTLAVCTVVGGYGGQDDALEPVFLEAFMRYYGPAMTATVIELVRLAPKPGKASGGELTR